MLYKAIIDTFIINHMNATLREDLTWIHLNRDLFHENQIDELRKAGKNEILLILKIENKLWVKWLTHCKQLLETSKCLVVINLAVTSIFS